MRPYLYIIELEGEEEYISSSLKQLYEKLVDYLKENKLDEEYLEKLTFVKIQNIYSNRAKNRYPFIKKINRVLREEYVKDELELRYSHCKETRKSINVSKILKRRGINN